MTDIWSKGARLDQIALDTSTFTVADVSNDGTSSVSSLSASGGVVNAAEGRPKASGTAMWVTPGIQQLSTMAGAETNYTLNTANYHPIWIESTVVIDAFGIEVTTLEVGGLFYIGIYNCDSDLQPTTLVTNTDVAGISTTTTGVKTATFSDTTLTRGRYLIWHNCNGNTLKTRSFTYFPQWYPSTLGGTNGGRLTVSQTASVAPSTPTAWTGMSTGVNSVFIRVKTP